MPSQAFPRNVIPDAHPTKTIALAHPFAGNKHRQMVVAVNVHSNGVIMSKKWILLASVLSLGSAGTSQAHPQDSRDVVYIDGLPCNRACQSYMAWSRQTLSMSGRPGSGQFRQRSANAGVHRATALAGEGLNPAPARITTQAVPIPRERPQARVAALQPTDNAPARSNASPDTAGAAASSSTRTIKEQIAAATSLAAHVTAATVVPAAKPNDADGSSPNNMGDLVALLLVGPEIKSISALTGRDIAIDGQRSVSNDILRSAIVEAGAAEVQLSDGQTKAVDRLISGEVPAAVLTLVSPEAAEWFPDIAGFKILRVPISP
jgi:hypothetical protein